MKNKMNIFTREVKIGLVAVMALAMIVYGINWLKGVQMFQPSSYIYVKFSNVNGLTESSAVFADGVRVGLVRNIHYNYADPGNVIVEAEIDSDLRIPKGSSAELVSDLMGGIRLNLLLANNPREKHAVGDTIPGDLNTGVMDKVAQMMPQIEKILPRLDSILASIQTILSDPAIPATLHSLQTTTANLANASHQIKGVMSNDIPQLTGKLNTIGDNFVAISNNLKDVDYAATLRKIDATLANAQTLTDKLNSKEGSIGLLLNDPALYNNLNATSANAASLLEDLKARPKRYVHFSLFGKKDK